MANSLDDLKTAIGEIQALLRQLEEIDREAIRMEDAGEDIDPNDEIGMSPDYDELYKAAKQLWGSVYAIADQYELSSEKYFDTDEFESDLVPRALLNA